MAETRRVDTVGLQGPSHLLIPFSKIPRWAHQCRHLFVHVQGVAIMIARQISLEIQIAKWNCLVRHPIPRFLLESFDNHASLPDGFVFIDDPVARIGETQ